MYIYLDESGDLGFDFTKQGTMDIKKQVCEPYTACSSQLYQPMEGNAKRTIQDLLTNPTTSKVQKN